jgi:hypothetical protein
VRRQSRSVLRQPPRFVLLVGARAAAHTTAEGTEPQIHNVCDTFFDAFFLRPIALFVISLCAYASSKTDACLFFSPYDLCHMLH